MYDYEKKDGFEKKLKKWQDKIKAETGRTYAIPRLNQHLREAYDCKMQKTLIPAHIDCIESRIPNPFFEIPTECTIPTEMAMMAYRTEKCRICGKEIGNDKNPIYVGYSKQGDSRTAHNDCYFKHCDNKEEWVYSEDD